MEVDAVADCKQSGQDLCVLALGDHSSRPPAALIIRHRAAGLIVSARLRAPDPRILRVIVRPVRGGRGCVDSLRSVCRLPFLRRTTRHAAVAIDQWGCVTAADRHCAAGKRIRDVAQAASRRRFCSPRVPTLLPAGSKIIEEPQMQAGSHRADG